MEKQLDMLRFAPRYGIISPCLARPIRGRHLRAVNDNAETWNGSAGHQGAALDSALRLFAAHGFGAADRAREAAVIARRSGDPERSGFWLEVCRTLNRQMARDLAKRQRV